MLSVFQLARAGNVLAKWTPRGARHTLGFTVGSASYLAWEAKRKVTQLNMAQVTGRAAHDRYVKRLAFASWKNYGRLAADIMHFPYLDVEGIVRRARDLSQGAESWDAHVEHGLSAGHGVMIASGHFGNWDTAGAFFARHFPLAAVAETFSDPRLNQLLQNQRKEKGIGIIPMEGSARRILRVLQQNKVVAIVVDRPVSADEGTEVTFFGRKTYVPGGPAALALKSGAAIVPGYMWYGHHQEFYVRAFPPIFPSEYKGEDKDVAIKHLTQRMFDALEEVVREWPTQWYMFRQFWPS